jgi:hypothetical protein
LPLEHTQLLQERENLQAEIGTRTEKRTERSPNGQNDIEHHVSLYRKRLAHQVSDPL